MPLCCQARYRGGISTNPPNLSINYLAPHAPPEGRRTPEQPPHAIVPCPMRRMKGNSRAEKKKAGPIGSITWSGRRKRRFRQGRHKSTDGHCGAQTHEYRKFIMSAQHLYLLARGIISLRIGLRVSFSACASPWSCSVEHGE